ncbi:MAG: response regulator [Pseudomonadota bacterium]
MTPKCALIVDDSRSARVVLQRMLESHELDVDTAESAEQALDYLTEHRPDVIFMDHLMPGMDGFEAVQAIKENPATATIPIMMYTSQEGELYVGQARALGAVGVLPKQIAPVEVSRVLKSLRLIPANEVDLDVGAATLASESPSLVDVAAAAERLVDDDRDMRQWIQELFEQQRAVIRRDLLDSYESIATRVADEISPEAADDDGTSDGRITAPVAVAVGALCLITVAFAWLYWRAETKWQQAEAQIAELSTERLALREQTADGTVALQTSLNEERAALRERYQSALNLVAWSFNNGGRYAWNSIPLDDLLTDRLSELVRQLEALDFKGTLVVETHVGNFCTVADGSGLVTLAPGDLGVAGCTSSNLDIAEADRIGSQQTVAFANLVETVSEQTGGDISIAVSTLANMQPRVAYPDPATASAGQWNAVAAANQRIEIRLDPISTEL